MGLIALLVAFVARTSQVDRTDLLTRFTDHLPTPERRNLRHFKVRHYPQIPGSAQPETVRDLGTIQFHSEGRPDPQG